MSGFLTVRVRWMPTPGEAPSARCSMAAEVDDLRAGCRLRDEVDVVTPSKQRAGEER